MKSAINVLFFEPYPMGLGGNYLTQRLILERLESSRIKAIVVSPVNGIALREFEKMRVECQVIPPPGNLNRYGGAVLRSGVLGKMKSLIDLLRYNLNLAAFIRQKKIDVIYTNCVRAEMSIGLAGRLASVPSILYIKGELDNPVIDFLSFMLASKILFFCKQNRNDKYPKLIRMLRNKIDILKIGMDVSTIEQVIRKDQRDVRKDLNIDSGCTNTIVLAQLYRPKGQHLVIEAMSRLINDFPNTKLYLLGDHVIDEYRSFKSELEEMVKTYNLEEHVIFAGWRRDALDVLSLMDIVIHPSLAEGFGRAVLESMALGKPVIASRVGGLREAIKDGWNGFLIEPGDVSAIEKRWRKLLADSQLRNRLGQKARETVYAEYLIDDKVTQLSDIWSEMKWSRS